VAREVGLLADLHELGLDLRPGFHEDVERRVHDPRTDAVARRYCDRNLAWHTLTPFAGGAWWTVRHIAQDGSSCKGQAPDDGGAPGLGQTPLPARPVRSGRKARAADVASVAVPGIVQD